MGKNIVIIGGGIIGLCSAYYLLKDGHQVTVIDKSDISKGASFVNAGYITPSHIIPLAAPGMISKGIKWMLNASSPFYVKPRLDKEFLQWGWAFNKSASASKVARAIPIIKSINCFGRDLYEDLKAANHFNFHYERKGLLMYYKTDKAGEEEWKIGQRAMTEGLHVKHLSQNDVIKYEPHIALNIKGAVYYDSDAHTTPSAFMREILKYLKQNGVKFYTHETVEDITLNHGAIKHIKTNNRQLPCDEVVLAAGSWSPLLTKTFGLKIPIQAGKGYCINVKRPTKIQTPAILVEAKVAVTPMQGFTRFAGTMELSGINHNINPKRIQAIADAAASYYEGLKITTAEQAQADCGLRPCSPDGLPYIGKSKRCKNLTIATGHAMMGWSLGPATGKLVSEVIANKKTTIDLEAFHPDRTF
ncbi:NAD(P)/FAD-dependent oxidoreductase [Formosa haliotis]|uniref:NAD(P)/FAD-dependent oxidoreductase n=1 Tax=Formosa haliotis TaxID=1555194 RepID=UPI0008249C17|nr:FAD-dependent oxidoreductase [Formosa haliotis]